MILTYVENKKQPRGKRQISTWLYSSPPTSLEGLPPFSDVLRYLTLTLSNTNILRANEVLLAVFFYLVTLKHNIFSDNR